MHNHFYKLPSKDHRVAWTTLALSATALILTSCVGGRNYHSIPAEGPPPTPRYLELHREVQVATLHFPTGVYSLRAADDAGYYYAAPRKIIEHTAAGSRFRDGGIYVNKRDPEKLRGYVYWSGVRTHVGNFSKAEHEFRDENLQTNEQ